MITRPFYYLLWALTGAAAVATLLLHSYARISCHWRWPSGQLGTERNVTAVDEDGSSFMRMVVFADPQMEGDAKIRRLGKRAFVDLAFNDAYMRHIYRSMTAPSWACPWSTTRGGPSHVTVLGDLFSSQWIDDTEFNVRLARYQSIFPDPAFSHSQTQTHGWFSSWLSPSPRGQNTTPMLINITGNHDIGYGYDISQARLDRWETAFGKSNFITTVDIPSKMEGERQRLHLVVLNTMLLDGPSSDETLRGQTWEFMQEASRIKIFYPKDKIVLLTHIPFHKEQGICVDAPDIRVHWDSTIIEQTMLTPNTTNWILDNIKPDFVLNGHDHHGCDVIHVLEKEGSFSSTPVAATSVNNNDGDAKGSMAAWKAYAASSTQHPPSLEKKHTIREITQRSMMAEFGGYSGLFEARIQESSQDEDKIEFHYTVCGFYTDLQVWIVLVIDLIVVVAWILTALYAAIMIFSDQSGQCSQSYTNSHGSDALDKKPKML